MGAVFDGNVRMFYTRPSDNKTYCFRPVPLLAESKEFLKDQSGENRFATVHQLTFNGTLLPTRPELSGVPDESTCISLLDRKRDQLCDALSEDYGSLLVVDGTGYPIISAEPRVASLSFEEGRLVQQSPYSVVFEYDEVAGTGYIRDFTETWDFSQQENDTVSVSHAISAVGVRNPSNGNSAIQGAKDYVRQRIGGPDKSQSLALRSPIVSQLLDIDNLTGYNRLIQENIDVGAGSYGVTETWVMSSGSFLDNRTVEESYELDELNNLVKTININGTVQGYGETTFDKLANAENGFDTFVAPQIDFNAASGISAKTKSSSRINGTVAYSLSLIPSGTDDALTGRTVNRSIERQDDGSVLQTVTTSCSIRPGSTSTIDDAKAFCFNNNYPINSTEPPFDIALSGNLVSISVQRDELAKSFSLTRSFVDQSASLYTEEYTVNRSQNFDTSEATVSINGTVQGVGVETGTKSTVRFANASGAYFGTIEPLITSRIQRFSPTGVCISDEPRTKTLGFNELAGTITYSQDFASRFLTDNYNILNENINVGWKLQGDVIASFQVPGKSDGPILQDQETVTGLEKTLTISYTMRRNNSSCGTGSVSASNSLKDIAITESNKLVNNTPSTDPRGEKPSSSAVFKTRDEISWNRQSNQFTRNVTWKYI